MSARQQGVSLPIVLALLLGMALLGAAVLQSGVQHSKMAAQLHAHQLAFEAAEAALRAGEQIASASPIPPVPGCSHGLCGTPDANAPERWRQPGFTGWQAIAAHPELALPGAHVIVEYMGNAPTVPGCERIQPVALDCLRPLYRITARSMHSLLQSHYLDARISWREIE